MMKMARPDTGEETPEEKKERRGKRKAAGKAGKKPGGARIVPSETNRAALARALWFEMALKGKGRVAAEQRAQLWKADRKEYNKIAGRVIDRITRQQRKKSARAANAAKPGGPEQGASSTG